MYRTIKARIDELETRYEQLLAEKSALAISVNQRTFNEDSIKFALEFARHVRIGIENADSEVKRRVLELMQTRVKIKGKQVEVHTELPLSESVFEVTTSQSHPRS